MTREESVVSSRSSSPLILFNYEDMDEKSVDLNSDGDQTDIDDVPINLKCSNIMNDEDIQVDDCSETNNELSESKLKTKTFTIENILGINTTSVSLPTNYVKSLTISSPTTHSTSKQFFLFHEFNFIY